MKAIATADWESMVRAASTSPLIKLLLTHHVQRECLLFWGLLFLEIGAASEAEKHQQDSPADTLLTHLTMTEALLDSLPVASLQERYDIARSVVYERIKALRIETEKRGNKAYVNAQQIELLDNLHAFLKGGGSTAEFLVFTGLSAEQSGEGDEVTALEPVGQMAVEQMGAIAMLVEAIAQRLPATQPADPFANLEALERAAQNGWLLSTSQLAPLLGLKKLPRKELQRYGFTFIKVGKNGVESAWVVKKS